MRVPGAAFPGSAGRCSCFGSGHGLSACPGPAPAWPLWPRSGQARSVPLAAAPAPDSNPGSPRSRCGLPVLPRPQGREPRQAPPHGPLRPAAYSPERRPETGRRSRPQAGAEARRQRQLWRVSAPKSAGQSGAGRLGRGRSAVATRDAAGKR